METGATIWYLVRLALLFVFVVMAVVAAVILPRRRRFAGAVRVVGTAVLALAGTVLSGLSAARPSWLWLAGALVVGAVLGLLVGRLAEPSVRGGKPAVRRWAIAPVLQSLGVVVLAVVVLFGTPMLVALAMIWMALAWGMLAGCEIGEWTVAPRTAAAQAPGPVVAPAVPPVVTAPPSGPEPPPFPSRPPQT